MVKAKMGKSTTPSWWEERKKILANVPKPELTKTKTKPKPKVKVQEVGMKYTWMEQKYIRVQNAYSELYSASSESWETCIDERNMDVFKAVKDNRTTINIKVKGYGLFTRFTCITGDRVVDWTIMEAKK